MAMTETRIQACCRLCLSEKSDDLKSVFDVPQAETSLPQRILQYLTIEITTSDKLPTMVCNDCTSKINNWIAFKQECAENQHKLEQQWNNNYVANDMAEMSFQIKEEPMGDVSDERIELSSDGAPENSDTTLPAVTVKNEPMEEEYNELPPPLTPHPPEEVNSDELQEPEEPSSRQPTGTEQQDPLATEDPPNTTDPPSSESDQQKIQFAAGLKLLQKNSTPISCEPLSKIELSYIEKCKAMATMHQTLECACHNVTHPNLKGLLSHLRALRIWFPVFTCYNCMISFTDRSTFSKHTHKCPKTPLETIIQLSNLRKRSEVKTRLYQNFKCTSCRFMYNFHEEFCKHVDEEHAVGEPPFTCSCARTFDNVEDYKDHIYVSCLVDYYCDICFITVKTLDAFQKHAQDVHDQSEGFVLVQDDGYKIRGPFSKEKTEELVVTGKRERRQSVKAPILETEEELETPKKVINPAVNRLSNKRGPTKCPVCKREYSNYHNMLRHYRSHLEKINGAPLVLSGNAEDDLNASFYTCPDCGGMYTTTDWIRHLDECHEAKTCNDCSKVFQFQSELDQHRSVHLNLKVYRDSKTQSYKTSMLSPNSEQQEIMVMCEICDTMFANKEDLKLHKLTHDLNSNGDSPMPTLEASDESKYQCSPCNKVYAGYSGLWDHNKRMHPDRKPVNDWPRKCDQCEKTLSTPAAWATHKQMHDREKFAQNADKKPEYPRKCDQCDKVLSTGASYAIHKQMHERMSLEPEKKPEYPKQCDQCDKVLSTGSSYASHRQMHERVAIAAGRASPVKNGREWPKKCDYCDKMLSTGSALFLHHQMHERISLGDITKGNKGKKAVPDTEDESYHTCKRCFKVFSSKYNLRTHMKSHGMGPAKPGPKKAVVKRAWCEICHLACESTAALAKHKEDEHNDVNLEMPKLTNEVDIPLEAKVPVVYPCDLCSMTFNNKISLKRHRQRHLAEADKTQPQTSNRSSVYCKYCKIAFDSVMSLTKHMFEEHDESAKPKVVKEKPDPKNNKEKSFKCQVCKKGFLTLGAMTAHMGWHKRNRPLGNSGDASENTPQASMANKMAKHTKVLKKVSSVAAKSPQVPIEPPKFQCSTCLAELPNDTALQIHILEKHRSVNAIMLIPRCNICNQDFATQDEYETHKRFHDLLERQKKHEMQQQQEIMDATDAATGQTASSQNQMQKSTKNFPCNYCKAAFSRVDTLNTHIKQHHKEFVVNEFKCTQCDRVFDKQNSLSIHLKVHEKQKASAPAGKTLFSCSICNRGFSLPKDLRLHTINAHPF